MYDFRIEIVTLAERALQRFAQFRFSDIGIENTWRNGLKSFIYQNYPNYKASYEKLYVFLQSHSENELTLEQMDITSLFALIHYFWKDKGIYNVSPESEKLFICHIDSLRQLRNTLEHYPKIITESDYSKFYFDQLYSTESIASFSILVLKYRPSLDEWKEIYHTSKNLISKFYGEHWLHTDNNDILPLEDDLSTVISLAEQGNTDAQIKAGKAYYYGIRTNVDRERSFMWFYKAARKGNSESEYYVGLCYKTAFGVDYHYESAKHWIEKSANHGYAAAQYEIGIENFAKENISEEEKSKVFYWLEQSANQNYPYSVWALGLCYMIGYGIEKDIERGQFLKEKSATLGYGFASKELGNEAEKQGNYESAIKWYSLAKKQGENISRSTIERLQEKC